ncbi:tubulin-specific chaperone E-like [Dendronephthya gigantea]|uniref:tubulin-specific chaperone E-like n=1 Tax=Dendronephthya gigantea TaxID=151771 RepID=UPI00106AFD72|nr:tubulin-specific chaperone E-like [Dendronephthya gigantea]
MANSYKSVEGTRVVSDGNYGTIKYFGEIPPSTGLWYGIEWDVDGRGKHSGEHEGVKYFTCKRPGNGSFVRAKKLDFGINVVTALLSKFSELHSTEEFSEFDCVYHVSKNESGDLEEKLKRLERVSLRGTNVSRGPEDGKSLSLVAPNIVELDLSNTLLCEWQEVVRIVTDLPCLIQLDISGLHLKPSSFDLSEKEKSPKLALKTLVVNYMQLDWQDILTLTTTFSGLQEVHASFNNINSLRCKLDLSSLSCLCKLNLEGNNLSNWDELFLLNEIPHLEVLVVSDNPLGDVSFPGDIMESADIFPWLKSLALMNTMISSWSSINQLNRLQVLGVLTLKCCPLVSGMSQYDARQELIARIAKCGTLNGSDVTVKERLAAERAYIKKYGQEYLASGGNTNISQSNMDSRFLIKHPKYMSLLQSHGIPDGLGSSPSNVNTLKSSLIVVTIKCVTDIDRQSVTKKLPGSMTIAKLKGLLQRIFKVPPSSQILSYVDKSDHEIKLDDDLRPLSFYSVGPGDTIYLKW